MATERLPDDPGRLTLDADDPSGRANGTHLSRTAVVVITLFVVLLIAWFFIAWLMLERNIVDAAGESIGTAFAILLLISLFGAFKKHQ